MKAAFFEQFGDPEVLKYGDLPDPVAAPGEVVVGVNAVDWKFRAGQYPKKGETIFPLIPGRDFSGVVGALGNGVDLKVGDAVFGVLDASLDRDLLRKARDQGLARRQETGTAVPR
jgi:NADPH:quinone reductase-like Zn-dependent oxidoreductase